MEDIRQELKKEPITAVMLILNLIVFFAVDLTGGSQNIEHMINCGAAYTPLILENREWYRIFTCMFLHFGMAHLVNNMLVLFVLGGRLERTVGKVRFLLIYILGGISGNLCSIILDLKTMDYAVSAGASGAVFAVMGAMIYVLLRRKGRVEDVTARQMVIMAAFSLYFGFTSSGVDNAAHIGGILSGFLLALLLYHPRKTRTSVP